MSLNLRPGLEPYPGYRLLQFLGRGGWGQVWKAEDPYKKSVALKFLGGESNSPSYSYEIKALTGIRQLSHPNLLKIENIWSGASYLVICMELADGSLQDLLEISVTELGTPLQTDHLCSFLEQAALGVDFLNARHHMVNQQRVAFRHCDIKPSNLLIVGNTVKLADFSLSYQTSITIGHHQRTGTLHYAAPEVFKGLVSEWSDQYSLAVSYCQLRLGRFPFPSPPTRFTSTYERPEPDLDGMLRGEQEIVRRALDPVPQGRWKNCSEFVRKLQNTFAPPPPNPFLHSSLAHSLGSRNRV